MNLGSLLFLYVMQHKLVVHYRHFGTTYWSHPSLKMEPIGCLNTSVTN